MYQQKSVFENSRSKIETDMLPRDKPDGLHNEGFIYVGEVDRIISFDKFRFGPTPRTEGADARQTRGRHELANFAPRKSLGRAPYMQ